MITEIGLKNFRSYADKTFSLGSGVNIVVGPNASGKTNLLEAVMVSCVGSSYRAADADLVTNNESWARIDLKLNDGSSRTVKIKLSPNQQKQFDINGKLLSRLDLSRQVPVVLFEPNHLMLLTGSPELRRTYIDGVLDQTMSGYKKLRNDYIKTVRQRNYLLKNQTTTTMLRDIFPWNIRLSQLGGAIVQARMELIDALNKEIAGIYRSISNDQARLAISYKASVDTKQYESQLLRKLESAHELDLLRGFTAYGPHREDMELTINNKAPASIASRGETRSLTIALKVLEHQIIGRIRDVRPLLLLDDVFSELDQQRRSSLAEYLQSIQSIITTTDADQASTYAAANIIQLG